MTNATTAPSNASFRWTISISKKRILYRPLIQLNRPDGTPEIQIAAKEARWNPATREWQFFDGQSFSSPSIKLPIPTQTYSVPIKFHELALKTRFAPDPDSLQKTKRDLTSDLRDHNFEMVSRAQLANYRANQLQLLASLQKTARPPQKLLGDTRKEINAATFGIHDKLATPLVVLALVLIGAPLGVRPQRTASPGLAMGLSIMVLLLYYLGWVMVNFWGKAGFPQPMFAAYLPVIAIAATGAALVRVKSG